MLEWFRRLFQTRANPENPSFDLSDPDAWRTYMGSGGTAETDEPVNVERALSLSAVWKAVKIISGDCSKLPLKIYRYRRDSEGKDIDRRHQAYPYISRDGRANAETSALQLWRQYFACTLLWENGYIWIDRDDLGRIHGLYNLLPDRTAPVRVGGRLWYVTEVNGRLEPLPADDVLHLRGLCWDGMQAPMLVRMARHDFGVALAARKFTSKFFANGAQHGGILQVPPGQTKEARDKIEQGVEERRRNLDRAFKTLVLRDGYKWISTTVEPEKAQLTELDQQEIRHVSNWFLLPASKLGLKESTSYNSEESARQDYYDSCLSYWLSANVAECACKLLTERERVRTHCIRYQINALLWADAATRAQIAVSGIQAGRFSPDETRDWEGMNPRPDGEGGRFLRPLNSEAVGAADPEDDPEDDDPDADQDAEDVRAAHRALVEDSLSRAVKRLASAADRAARNCPDAATLIERLSERQRQQVTELLTPVIVAARSAGTCDRWQPEKVVDMLWDQLTSRLADLPADSLRSAVTDAFRDVSLRLPRELAAMLCTSQQSEHSHV
jgi:HK97 family phage portal protein